MDRQMMFLQVWSATLQPLIDEMVYIMEHNSGKAVDDKIEALFNKACEDVRVFMVDDPGHGFLEEMVITGTHYLNLMYNYGVFDEDNH